MNSSPTAALLIIGNEILSGRTQDKNLNFLATRLAALGIRFREVRVVADVEEEIIAAVRALSGRYDYLFTTGGIGPTHDDISSASIAKAFDVALVRNVEAERRLRDYYKGEINDARLKMADVPEGALLIDNPVSAAPGFIINNVYVMAGVPRIMQAMFENIVSHLRPGVVIQAEEVRAYISESQIAAKLSALQAEFPTVDIGSYPFVQDKKFGTVLVARGEDLLQVKEVAEKIRALVVAEGGVLGEREW